MRHFFSILLLALVLSYCTQSSQNSEEEVSSDEPEQVFIPNDNPPADGFNIEDSDPIAIIIADKVMNAMGGRKALDSTRYITWNFFGSRRLLWDKQTGDVRVKSLRDDREVILNIGSKEGMVFKEGVQLTEPDSISKYVDWGYRVWVNDSYWLVMPFKLKDSGVTLSYVGESQTLLGEPSERLRLTFENVGVTPQNAYEVWVSLESDLVKQWSYYPNATDSIARFTLPWDNYQKKGGILLSDERGDRDLSDVEVLETVPQNIFTSFDEAL
jgi:hypothetical protein